MMDEEQRALDPELPPAGQNTPPPPPAAQEPPAGQPSPGQPASGQPSSGEPASGDPAASPDGASTPGPGADGTSAQAAEATPAEPGGKQPGGKRRKQPKGKKSGSFWRELPVLVIVALILALLIKTYAFQAYFIPSGSMQNTLEIGDKILVNKVVYHLRSIHRGDIVVFNGAGSWDPGPTPKQNVFDRFYHAVTGLFGAAPGQTDYVKRVIGVPGDHVQCCNAQGLVTVNGVALHEKSYLYPGNPPSQTPFNITVQPGRLWVMGDHRDISDDSRDHIGYPGGGTIPENMVVGRAFWIVWPPSRWRVLDIPSTFEQSALNNSSALSSTVSGKTMSTAATLAALNDGLAVPVKPSAPALPLAVGLAGAIPLTWAQRRLRRRVWAGRTRRRLARSS